MDVQKISLLYEDPKKFDGTAKESIVYDDRCREISRELLFTFSLLSNKTNSER